MSNTSGRRFWRKRVVRKSGDRKMRGKFPTRKSSVSQATKKYVKQMIHSSIENKVLISSDRNSTIASAGGINSVPTFIQLVPTLGQGTTNSTRIGNAITVKKSYIVGSVNILPYNSVSNPLNTPTCVKMWLCRRKQANIAVSSVPTSADFNYWFETSGSSSNFLGDIRDTFATPNKDYWTILGQRTFNFSTANAGGFTTGGLNSPDAYVNKRFSFPLTKHLGKCIYNDTASSFPTNKELYLVLQSVQCDGTTSSALQLAEFHYHIRHEYEDA